MPCWRSTWAGRITDKHEDNKQATIILPEPQVLQPRVDHSRTRTWSVERVAWLPWNADQDACVMP